METTFQLHARELDADFLNKIKQLFRDSELEITVKTVDLKDKEWLRSLSINAAFDFLLDEAEDIYKLDDGKPLENEI